MISELRKNISSPTNRFIIWLSVLGVAGVFSIPAVIKNMYQNQQPWALSVNGDIVLRKDFEQQVQQNRLYIEQFKARYGQYADVLLESFGHRADPRSLAIDNMVREVLLVQLAHMLGIVTSSAVISAYLRDPNFLMHELGNIIPTELITVNGIDRQLLAKYLQHMGITTRKFEERIEEAIARKSALNVIMAGSYVPFFERNAAQMHENARRVFSILRFDLAHALAKVQEMPITDEEARAYYDQQNATFRPYDIPEKRSGVVWEFDPYQYGVRVDEQQIESYYEQHKQSYIEEPTRIKARMIFMKASSEEALAVQEKLQHVHEELSKDPESFARVAQEISQDASASRGGLLDSIGRNETEDAERERAIFRLQQDGALSPVVAVKNGFAIFQRVERIPAQYKPVSQVRADIEKAVAEKNFKRLFYEDVRSYITDPEGFNEQRFNVFAQKKHASMRTISSVTPADSLAARKLFELPVGNAGSFIDAGKGYVVMDKEIIPPATPSFDSIRDRVITDMYTQRAQALLKEQAIAARAGFNQLTVQEAQEKFGASSGVETGPIAMDYKEGTEKLPLDKMFSIHKEGLTLLDLSPDVAYVVRLDKFSLPETGQQEEEKKAALQLERERMQGLTDGIVASLYRNATIKINEILVNSKEDLQNER